MAAMERAGQSRVVRVPDQGRRVRAARRRAGARGGPGRRAAPGAGTRPGRFPAAVGGAGRCLHRVAARGPGPLSGSGTAAGQVAGRLSRRADRGRRARRSGGLPGLHPALRHRGPGEHAGSHALQQRPDCGAHAPAQPARADRPGRGERGRGQRPDRERRPVRRRRLRGPPHRGIPVLHLHRRRRRAHLPLVRVDAADHVRARPVADRARPPGGRRGAAALRPRPARRARPEPVPDSRPERARRGAGAPGRPGRRRADAPGAPGGP